MANKWFDLDWILPLISSLLGSLVRISSRGGALFFAIGAIHFAFTNAPITQEWQVLGACWLAGLMLEMGNG